MSYNLGEVFQVRQVKVNCERVQLICYCWHKFSVSPARIWHVSLCASNNICASHLRLSWKLSVDQRAAFVETCKHICLAVYLL